MNRPLFCVLTGGIASGKSTVLRLFQKYAHHLESFDADNYVGKLYARREVQQQLVHLFGQQCYCQNGKLNKAWIRQHIFSFPQKKQQLENLIHPLVARECLAKWHTMVQTTSKGIFIADIPLFFEGKTSWGEDETLLVSLLPNTQRERLLRRNAWSEDMTERVIASQMPLSDKIPLASVLFWNEGLPWTLEAQVKSFLQKRHLLLPFPRS